MNGESKIWVEFECLLCGIRLVSNDYEIKAKTRNDESVEGFICKECFMLLFFGTSPYIKAKKEKIKGC